MTATVAGVAAAAAAAAAAVAEVTSLGLIDIHMPQRGIQITFWDLCCN